MEAFLRPRIRRALAGTAVVSLVLAAAPRAVLAGTEIDPTPSAGKGSLTANQAVTYKWVGTIPSYVRSAYTAALETNFENATWNNSRSPTLAYSSTGTAGMYWDALDDSPCNSQINLQWLQCSRNWGTTSFQIHIRNLESDGGQYPQPPSATPTWVWWDTNASCTRHSCWYLRRALIHEVTHAILNMADTSTGHYDTDTNSSTDVTEADSVMQRLAPQYSASGGQRLVLQRCDEAGAQLTWDVDSFAGPYANCFGDVAGAGAEGLLTSMTSTATGQTIPLCQGDTASVSGRLQVKAVSGYGVLGGNPLQGRTVTWDRGTSIAYGTTTTTVASPSSTGTNWSHAFAGSATWTVYHNSTSGSDGVDDSNKVTFKTVVQSPC